MTDLLFYNPFARVQEDSLRKLLAVGKPHVLIQRFAWPGQDAQRSFLLSAYSDEQEARAHLSQLRLNEGKYFDLLEDFLKVGELVKTGSGLAVFYHGTFDKRHEKRLQDAYRKKVYAYIQYIRMKKVDHYDVRIFVEFGRIQAEITSGEQSHQALFYEMIR